MQCSEYRVVLDPAGASPLVLVDWGELSAIDDLPSWSQGLDRITALEGVDAIPVARGGAALSWPIVVIRDYASMPALAQGWVELVQAIPLSGNAVLDVRVRDVTAAEGDTEAERTALHLQFAKCAVGKLAFKRDGLRMTITIPLELSGLSVVG